MNQKRSVWWEVLPAYLMVAVTLVYAGVTYKILTDNRRINKPIISIGTSGETQVYSDTTTKEETWLVLTKITNTGKAIAKELKWHVWFDGIENILFHDLESIKEALGPFSIGPQGSFNSRKSLTASYVLQTTRRKKKLYRHTIATYEDESGGKYKSVLTAFLVVRNKKIIWNVIERSEGEFINK